MSQAAGLPLKESPYGQDAQLQARQTPPEDAQKKRNADEQARRAERKKGVPSDPGPQ